MKRVESMKMMGKFMKMMTATRVTRNMRTRMKSKKKKKKMLELLEVTFIKVTYLFIPQGFCRKVSGSESHLLLRQRTSEL